MEGERQKCEDNNGMEKKQNNNNNNKSARVAQPGHVPDGGSCLSTLAVPMRFRFSTRQAQASLRGPQEKVSLFIVGPQPKRRDQGWQRPTSNFQEIK